MEDSTVTCPISEKEAKELIREKKFSELRGILLRMYPADIAEFFEQLDRELCPILYRILPKELRLKFLWKWTPIFSRF